MPRKLIRSAARTAGRTAIVAGTASAVAGRVGNRQRERFGHAPQAAPQAHAAPPPLGGGDGGDVAGQLQVLADLRASGALSDKEFAAAKARVLQR